MRHRAKANFNYLEHYTYFVPDIPELLILMLWLVVGAVLGNVVSAIFLYALGPQTGTEVGILVAYPVMFIPAMLFASSRSRSRCFNRPGIKLDSNNFGQTGACLCAVLAMVGTLALSYCADAASSLLPSMPEKLKAVLKSMTEGNFFLNFICVSLFAPIFEEWLCRGMVLRGLLGDNVKPALAIVISALFFATIHLNPWQALPAFMLGCLFGYVYYKTGSLKLTMLMHFTNNTMALILSNVAGLETVDGWKDIIPGAAYWVLFAALLLLVALVIRQLGKIELKSPKGNMDEVPALFTE